MFSSRNLILSSVCNSVLFLSNNLQGLVLWLILIKLNRRQSWISLLSASLVLSPPRCVVGSYVYVLSMCLSYRDLSTVSCISEICFLCSVLFLFFCFELCLLDSHVGCTHDYTVFWLLLGPLAKISGLPLIMFTCQCFVTVFFSLIQESLCSFLVSFLSMKKTKGESGQWGKGFIAAVM